MNQITFARNFRAWQKAARSALQQELSPDAIAWEEVSTETPALALFEESEPEEKKTKQFFVPKAFLELAKLVGLHADEKRWALLYRILWRLTHNEPKLLEVFVEPDVARANEMSKSVRHDIHKMRAFVRFREVKAEEGTWFVAWFEPQHHIVEYNAKFFADRFASMRWSILTPDRCVHWDGNEIRFTEGVDKTQAPTGDATEALWLTYYSNIFNPARIKVHAMQAEMPQKYWRNLPETTVIPELLRDAPARVETMMKRNAGKISQANGDSWRPAEVPATHKLGKLEAAAKVCTACPLYKKATQTVFGDGPKRATILMIGEQPGDAEDLAGKPFVGPAGKVLDRAMEEAGIDRAKVYVTNAVKHFKWEPRGKRRIHQKPSSRDVAACRPWLEAELRLVQPNLVVCLGATAAQAIFGPSFRVTKERGKVLVSPLAKKLSQPSIHPRSCDNRMKRRASANTKILWPI